MDMIIAMLVFLAAFYGLPLVWHLALWAVSLLPARKTVSYTPLTLPTKKIV